MTKKTPPAKLSWVHSHATPPLLKAIFSTTDLTWPKRPPGQNFMGANCNATPPLLKAIFFDYRFDLTNFDPPCQNFMGVICHVTPVLNDILDLCRFDLTYLTPLPKFHRCILSCYTCVKWYFRSMQIWLDIFDPSPCQNFTGAFCHVTPVLNDILDLCRYDLTYLTPLLKFHRCNLLCYTCVKWYFRSMQIWFDIFDPPTKILWMDFITLHHSCSTNQHLAAPDTTKTTCYRSAAQCWKAFLV